MKKTIYIAFVAALCMLASCTKQSIGVGPIVSGSSRSYIFFEPEVYNEVSSKAALLTEGNLPAAAGTAFGVLGYYGNTALFNGVTEVKRAVNAGPFDYEGLVAWQDNTTNHDFYAVYPYSLHSDVKPNNANPYLSYTQPTSDDDMIDVLTAKTSTKKTSDNNVSLTFHHRLWALDVEITNSQIKGLDANGVIVDTPDLTIKTIKIYVKDFPKESNIPLDVAGTITYGDENISPEEPYEIFVSSVYNTIEYQKTETYGVLLFAPVPANTFKYKLEITFEDSRGVESTFRHPYSGYKTSSNAFIGGRVYSLIVNKKDDVFVVGQFENNGNWTDVEVPHTFN